MIKKIAFIGHRVSEMDRAKKFYGELLGLKQTAEYEGNSVMPHEIAPDRAKDCGQR